VKSSAVWSSEPLWREECSGMAGGGIRGNRELCGTHAMAGEKKKKLCGSKIYSPAATPSPLISPFVFWFFIIIIIPFFLFSPS